MKSEKVPIYQTALSYNEICNAILQYRKASIPMGDYACQLIWSPGPMNEEYIVENVTLTLKVLDKKE